MHLPLDGEKGLNERFDIEFVASTTLFSHSVMMGIAFHIAKISNLVIVLGCFTEDVLTNALLTIFLVIRVLNWDE